MYATKVTATDSTWRCAINAAADKRFWKPKGTSTLCRMAHSSTGQQGHAAKVAPCHRLGCGMLFDAAWPKNSISKLAVHKRKPRSIDATSLFSVVLKTADRVAPMPEPANGIPSKGELVAYMIRHKYGSTRAVAAGNNFTSTSVLYCIL